MMCRASYLSFIILPFLLATVGASGQLIVRGVISDSTNTLLSFVTISARSSSGVVYSAIADSTGTYRIHLKDTGGYRFSYSRINYTSKSTMIPVYRDTVVNVTLAFSGTRLSELVIPGKRLLLERRVDRFVVNFDNADFLKGKNTTDVLRAAPGIYINNGIIQMADKDNVIVFINDLPVYLSGRDLVSYLNSLPQEQISSIEVISNPPAKYDAEGNIGVINVIMKKNVTPGLKGSARIDYLQGTYPGAYGSANIDYKTKKLSFFSMIGGYDISSYTLTRSMYEYPGETLYNDNPRKNHYDNLNGQIGFDYILSKGTTTGINYLFIASANVTIKDLANRVDYSSLPGVIDSSLFTNGVTEQHSSQNNINYYLDHNFGRSGMSMSIQLAFLQNDSKSNRPFSSAMLAGATEDATQYFMTTGTQNNHIYTAKLDFTYPMKAFNLSWGGKLSFINNHAGSNFYDFVNSVYLEDTTQSDAFIYTENTQALYVNLVKSIGRWSFQAGLRGEFTQTSGNSIVLKQIIDTSYYGVFPTANISYTLPKNSSLSISYGRRISRPPYSYLDPFRWYIDKYFYAEGNPYTQPSFTNTVELGLSLGSQLHFKAYYNRLTNGFGQIVDLLPDSVDVQRQTIQNYLSKSTYGLSVHRYFNRIPWLESIWQFDFNYQQYYSIVPAYPGVNGFSGNFQIYNIIYLKKNKNVQAVLSLSDKPPGIYEYRNIKNAFSLDMGFNYLMPKQRLEFYIYAADVLKTNDPQYSYTSNNVKQIYNNYFDTRQVWVTVKYEFGNSYIHDNAGKTSSNEEEKNRINQ